MRPLRRPRTPRRAGFTALEMLVASSLTAIIVLGAVGTLLTGMTSWYRGAGRIAAESSAQRVVRVIAAELRMAMEVTIDNDGHGLSYRLPLVDANGDFETPPRWDGVERRIELDLGADPPVILLGPAANLRVICRDVIARDPSDTGSSYRLFTAGEGGTVRQVTVLVATETIGAGSEQVHSRVRETVYLRNVP